MRKVDTNIIREVVKQMCIEANHKLSYDMEQGITNAIPKELSEVGKEILGQLKENMLIARTDMIPICQDTGMVIIFIKLGQEVYLEGTFINDAINQGVRDGYKEGYLRKSVVEDPIIRKNTLDNTPAVIHIEIVKGNNVEITVAPKGFGSENMSTLYMLKPSDGINGIKKAVIETVKKAGPNACPPIIVGVGLGGSFEKAAILAKQALLRNINENSQLEHIKQLEIELLEEINSLGIGPAGLGGIITALAVNILTYPTHIAGLPMGINLCCHVNRHITKII